jgi:SIR2-like domain
MQFMRRTLLAGAFKFDQYSTQVLPHAFLKQFQDYLLRVSSLVCIGYGCGDTHINQILRHWLEFSGDRQLVPFAINVEISLRRSPAA